MGGDTRSLERVIRVISDRTNQKASVWKNEIRDILMVIQDEDLAVEVISKIINSNTPLTFCDEDIKKFYNTICVGENPTVEKGIFRQIIDWYIKYDDDNDIDWNDFYAVYAAFNDKRLVPECLNIVCSTGSSTEAIISYIREARQYYFDDRSFLSAIQTVISEVDALPFDEDPMPVVERKLKEDRKVNGIYDVDQESFAEIDRKLERMLGYKGIIATLIDSAEKQIEILRNETEGSKSELVRAKEKELDELRARANNIIKGFDEKYSELLAQERESLASDKDTILSEINREVASHMSSLESLASDTKRRMNIEIGRIAVAANDAIKRLSDFIENHDEIKVIMRSLEKNDAFLDRLARIERLSEPSEKTANQDSQTVVVPSAGVTNNSNGVVVSPSSIVLPNIIIPETESRVVDPTVCRYFDTRIPFKERFDELMEKKNKDIKENGAIYHDKFDTVLKILMMDQKAPYLCGPSGCGKSYMITKQMADLLGINVIDNSYILYEQDVIGYTSANGNYVPSNTYRCYKYGDILFLDELDAGIANATVVLNKFIGQGTDKYTFPDGVTVQKHPNFRIVAAGNTNGNGPNGTYNTRKKLDDSVMQRCTTIEIPYDNRIEMRILAKNKGWFNFAVNFRKAIESIPTNNGERVNTSGTFTTRDAETIKAYLDDGVFTDEELLNLEFIATKEVDYLSQIEQRMMEQEQKGEFTPEGKKLLKKFHTVFEGRKRNN